MTLSKMDHFRPEVCFLAAQFRLYDALCQRSYCSGLEARGTCPSFSTALFEKVADEQ